MLVVLASRFDVDAAGLVERWRARGARLLTCEGLSRRGWILRPDALDRSWATIDGETVPLGAIRGVVSRLPRVTEFDVPQIVTEERTYVAAEMMAFLLAWLSSLPCPVLNRPTPLNLTGPSWHPEQWLREAKRAGLSTRYAHRSAPCFAKSTASGMGSTTSLDVAELSMSITVVGERCLREGEEELLDKAIAAGLRRLAGFAQVELLTATFVQGSAAPIFTGAVPSVDITRPTIADAVLSQLELES